jgi:HPt (histidine-containing phosphotransfer) domain-containing protein
MDAVAAERSEWTLAAGNSREPAIDLVHLARQTAGDAALEAELLGLFDRQAALLVAQLMAAPSRETSGDIAHKLRGSALAIGAGRVARGARAFEATFDSDPAGALDRPLALGELAAAVAEARAAIARLLG